MKIKKHGREYKDGKNKPKTEEFKCENCGCEFTVKTDEYYIHKNGAKESSNVSTWISTAYVISCKTTDYYVCSCPECHKIVKKIVENEDSNYSGISSQPIIYTTTTGTKPDNDSNSITITCSNKSSDIDDKKE